MSICVHFKSYHANNELLHFSPASARLGDSNVVSKNKFFAFFGLETVYRFFNFVSHYSE